MPIPSVSTSASSYGAFLGLSGNMRYQLVNGAERLMQDHFQHLGVVIFFSAALRYALCSVSSLCSDLVLNHSLIIHFINNLLDRRISG